LATAFGNTALFARTAWAERLRSTLPGCEIVDDPMAAHPDAVLFAGPAEVARHVRTAAAASDGALVPVIVADGNDQYDAQQLVCERTVTVNTTAAGGNASLLSLTEESA
jgi:RHH-type proline utilization regulon transcriptional repressor/proline dehydrogenase/delta 1-pyrroline-5-carboxylate dehydrogenase